MDSHHAALILRFYRDSLEQSAYKQIYPARVKELVIFEVSLSQVRPSSPRLGAFQSVV